MGELRRIDLTGLPPPEPLEQALRAVQELPEGDALQLTYDRNPVLLYPLVKADGFACATRHAKSGGCDVFLWRLHDRDAARLVEAVLAPGPNDGGA